MKTFKLIGADGNSYDVDAETEQDAKNQLDSFLAPSSKKTFQLIGEDGKSYNVDASSQEEAQAQLDNFLRSTHQTNEENALKVIKGDKPTALQEMTSDAVAAGKGFLNKSPLIVGGRVATDAILQALRWASDNKINPPTTEEGLNQLLTMAHLPTGDETPGARVVGAVSEGLGAQGMTKSVADKLNQGARTLEEGGTLRRSANFLAKDQAAQAAGNVAGTLTSQGLNEAGGDPTADMVLGTLTGILASRKLNNWGDVEKAIANGEIKDEDRKFLLQMAQKYPLMTQSAFPMKSGLGRFTQRIGGSVPVWGTAGQIEKQAEGVQSALQDTLNATEQGTKRAAIEDLIQSRGGRIGDLKAQKQQILDAASQEIPVNGSVETGPGNVSSAKIKSGKEVQTETKAGILPNIGSQAVDVEATIPGNSGTKISGALDQIESLKQRLQGANNPSVFGPYMNRLDALANALKQSDPNGIELNRQVLRDMYTDPTLGNVGKTLAPMARSLYGSVADSLSETIHSKLGSQVGTKWDQINKILAGDVKDLNVDPFRSALNKGSANINKVDSLMNYVENQQDFDVAKNMLKDLSTQGKLDMGNAIVARWFQKAGLAADNDVTAVNADKMIAELRKTYGPAGLFFSPEQTNQAKGLLQYMKAVQAGHSSDVNWSNPLHWGAAILAGPVMKAYNSKAMRDMLIRLHDMSPKDPRYQNLVQQINNTFQRSINEDNQNEN